MKKNQQNLDFLHFRQEEEFSCPIFYAGRKSLSHEDRFCFSFDEAEASDENQIKE